MKLEGQRARALPFGFGECLLLGESRHLSLLTPGQRDFVTDRGPLDGIHERCVAVSVLPLFEIEDTFQVEAQLPKHCGAHLVQVEV